MKNSNSVIDLPSIVDLRRLGYKVRVSHFRNVVDREFGLIPFLDRVTKVDKKNGIFAKIFERGGKTEIELTNRDGKTFNAVARCSEKDAFNRRLGNHICLARLAKQGAF